MKYLFSVLLCITVWFELSAQDMSFKSNEIQFSVGISNIVIKDARSSAIAKSYFTPTYGFDAIHRRNDSRHQFSFRYSQKMRTLDDVLEYDFFKPDFFYSFQKRQDDFWIGGFVNLSTLVSLPKSTTSHFGNTPVNYTMANSIGLSMAYDHCFNGSNWALNTDVHLPLASYVIRPAYGHPYPKKYLEEGTFSPTRSGMTGPLLRSGKLLTLNKFQAFKINLSISYLINERVRVGLRSRVDFSAIQMQRTSSFSTKDLLLFLGYNY